MLPASLGVRVAVGEPNSFSLPSMTSIVWPSICSPKVIFVAVCPCLSPVNSISSILTFLLELLFSNTSDNLTLVRRIISP